MELKPIPNLNVLLETHKKLVQTKNEILPEDHGWYSRFANPVLTARHIPIHWRFDLNAETNPLGMETIGVNAAFNVGAIKWDGKYVLAVRVEGVDRKSYFAFAESDNGLDTFHFWDVPLLMPQNTDPDVNVYDMRLTHHEDGYVYGVFCTERKDHSNGPDDTSSAIAAAGIVRTKDFKDWERLPDFISPSQQRNVTLHPEFVEGKYAVYTRPQDGFIETGSGGGIGLGFVDDMEHPLIKDETILFKKRYHTVYELKNGQGPSPIKTDEGWLHLAHGVRENAAGLRYVLYVFMTELEDISKIKYQPGGYFMAPNNEEIIGDVGNVLFCNGWIQDEDGTIKIYYASSDTRTHVAVTHVDRMIMYCKNTPPDSFHSNASVSKIIELIDRNKKFL